MRLWQSGGDPQTKEQQQIARLARTKAIRHRLSIAGYGEELSVMGIPGHESEQKLFENHPLVSRGKLLLEDGSSLLDFLAVILFLLLFNPEWEDIWPELEQFMDDYRQDLALRRQAELEEEAQRRLRQALAHHHGGAYNNSANTSRNRGRKGKKHTLLWQAEVFHDVCLRLYAVTQQRSIWIRKLTHLLNNGAVLPHHLKEYHNLPLQTLEALVWRNQRLQDKRLRNDMSALKVSHLYLKHSISWLRLVAGRWLFCAFSDNATSGIGCWDVVSVFAGHVRPIAIGYLPGRVQTAQLEVQTSRVVIALGLGPEMSAVHVLSLQRSPDNQYPYSFCELACINNSSHILLLSGNLIGCAVHHGDNVPHLIDWKRQMLVGFAIPPGGLDVAGRRSVPHNMFLCKDILIVARQIGLEVYSVRSSISFIKTIEMPAIWEISACQTADSSIRLFFISPHGIEALDANAQMLSDPTADSASSLYRLASAPTVQTRVAPWYNLCVGNSGTRALWVTVASEPLPNFPFRRPPCFVSAAFSFRPTTIEISRIRWTPGSAADPALWAIPIVDFDECLGITVFGNCFGELAIYDHCGPGLHQCTEFSLPTTDSTTSLLPQVAIDLNLPFSPQRNTPSEALDLEAATAQWSKANLDIADPGWATSSDWTTESFMFRQMALWQCVPGDWAWALTHVYGFPGRVLPQVLICHAGEVGEDCLVFQVGNRFMLHTEMNEFKSCVVQYKPDGRPFWDALNVHDEEYTSATAATKSSVFVEFAYSSDDSDDSGTRRNRWHEMWLRGGTVDWKHCRDYCRMSISVESFTPLLSNPHRSLAAALKVQGTREHCFK
ncbi:hypothetical protein MIND_00771900 [Mycena indigotica]|uniref:Uncharacterized protein n=1 Tax=Mycena indigotica TaxID=2126181 RepID=A0A8H6W1G6_9AGAR|nr:uncharacterized protein MIND_00771900 [Mycena indigotica]KAF7302054.1 hypothetical protein MIND_00771900 [Mycena indigotica]